MEQILPAQMSAAQALTGRRAFLGGLGAVTAALALPGCATTGGFSMVEALRRLLTLSASNAFARLTSDGGFYDNSLTRLDLPNALGSRGNILTQILTSALVKDRLQRAFNGFAEDAAERAAPVVYDTVRTIGFANAAALVTGKPTAGTSFLRDAMAGSLVETMVPALGDAMRLSREPVVGQLLSQLTGVDLASVTRDFAGDIDNAIWGEMGRKEADIRANPQSTNDPLLMGVFGVL